MSVTVEMAVRESTDPSVHYVGWSPIPASARVVDPDGVEGPVTVVIAPRDATAGGQVDLRIAAGDPAAPELTLALPIDGSPVPFTVAGRFGEPSTADGDAAIVARDSAGAEVGALPLMVRVRKDADTFTEAERDRFLSAFSRLNDAGNGPFTQFREAHTNASAPQAHGDAGFLPWHRAYLLDLERELQAVDPAVALPYWRFDQPAPNLFTEDHIGGPRTSNGTVGLAPGNPLRTWTTDGQIGILRSPLFDPALSGAASSSGPVATEAVLVGHQGGYDSLPRPLEGDPHGAAHVSFSGSISSIDAAARDPLFFLLHCNVDRLWAKWQWFHGHHDPASPAAYPFGGAAGSPGAAPRGHNRLDTMWPWDGDTRPPRPPTAPRAALATSPTSSAPGPTPTVGDMIDYQGRLDPDAALGFDYDDVPF